MKLGLWKAAPDVSSQKAQTTDTTVRRIFGPLAREFCDDKGSSQLINCGEGFLPISPRSFNSFL